MSCYILSAESFEALAVTLGHYKIKVPSPVTTHTVADPTGWAALAWVAADANVTAYCHRYKEPAAEHPLEAKHGTWEAWRSWVETTIAKEARRPRTEEGLVKLLVCLSYQIDDAPEGSEAAHIGEDLRRLAAEVALGIVTRTESYQRAAWGDAPEEVSR